MLLRTPDDRCALDGIGGGDHYRPSDRREIHVEHLVDTILAIGWRQVRDRQDRVPPQHVVLASQQPGEDIEMRVELTGRFGAEVTQLLACRQTLSLLR